MYIHLLYICILCALKLKFLYTAKNVPTQLIMGLPRIYGAHSKQHKQ